MGPERQWFEIMHIDLQKILGKLHLGYIGDGENFKNVFDTLDSHVLLEFFAGNNVSESILVTYMQGYKDGQ